MNNENSRRMSTILLIAVVLVYTVYNYIQSGATLSYLLVMAVFLLYLLVVNVFRLIRDMRNS